MFQTQHGIRNAQESRGLGDVFKRKCGKGRLQANEKGIELRCGNKGWPWFDDHICDGIICKEYF